MPFLEGILEIYLNILHNKVRQEISVASKEINFMLN